MISPLIDISNFDTTLGFTPVPGPALVPNGGSLQPLPAAKEDASNGLALSGGAHAHDGTVGSATCYTAGRFLPP